MTLDGGYEIASSFIHNQGCGLLLTKSPLVSGRALKSKSPLNPDCHPDVPRKGPDVYALLCMEAIMAQGTVKFYNAQKGYGFIQPDDGGKDVFVHATALEAAGIYSLAEGQKVSFELVESRGKMAAGQLRTV